MTTYRFASVIAAISILVFSATRVSADFSGPYAVPQNGVFFPDHYTSATAVGAWTLTSSYTPAAYPDTYLLTNPDKITFNTGIAMDHNSSDFDDIQLSNVIAADGILSFDYSLSLTATGAAEGFNYGGYFLNGVLVKLSNGTGSVSVPVSSGDTFGFEAYAGLNCVTCPPPFNAAGGTNMSITNFSAPVPEPSVVALFLCASAGFAASRQRLSGRGRGRADSLSRF